MKDHRSKLDVPGIGTWVMESEHGAVEFLGDQDAYAQGIRANLYKFFDGGKKASFVDPQNKFVLLDAQDELIRGEAATGALKTVISVNRIPDHGLRHSKFISAPNPVFLYEQGIVVFDKDGNPMWSKTNLQLTDYFRRIEGDRIVYSSEQKGTWSYDLHTGNVTNAIG